MNEIVHFRDEIDALRQDLAVDIESRPRCPTITVYAPDGSIAATIRATDSIFEAERSRADYTVIVGVSDGQAKAIVGRLTAYGAASWMDAVRIVSTIVANSRGQEKG